MFTKLQIAIQRYVSENFDDLLKLDLKVARILGAPAPHTLSSYAYRLNQEGKFFGKVFMPLIDEWYGVWIREEPDHCKKDYERVMNGFQGTPK